MYLISNNIYCILTLNLTITYFLQVENYELYQEKLNLTFF